MLFVLLLLCVYYSFVTLKDQNPSGAEAARQVAQEVISRYGTNGVVFIAAGQGVEAEKFVETLNKMLLDGGVSVKAKISGEPVEVRAMLEEMAQGGILDSLIFCSQSRRDWLTP